MILFLACSTAPDTTAFAPLDLATDDLGYDQELAALDRQIEDTLDRAGDSWPITAIAVSLLKQRARLSGDYADYARAEELLERAEAQAPEGSGPHMVRARFDYTLHRLDRVEASIASAESSILLDDLDRASFASLRGDLAWQRGETETAATLWAESQELHWSIGVASSQSQLAARTLDFAGAEALLDAAEGDYHGLTKEPLAWFDVQRGLLDLERGRYDQALAHYLDAEEDLSGYWLVREHIAEILVLQGRMAEAEAIYLEVIEQTGNPEFMDAMAGIELERGNEDAAQAWIERAEARYASQLGEFPEAAAGHALDHHLEFGDPAVALSLAEENARLRPNAEALAGLASAQLANGHDRAALRTIEAALEGPLRTAALHLVAAEVHAANGEADRAQEHLDRALAINPRALD